MKKIFTLVLVSVAMLCQSVSLSAKSDAAPAERRTKTEENSAIKIYNRYSDLEGVSAVYISPAMFKMMGSLPEIDTEVGEDVNLAPIVRTLRGMYLISIEDARAAKDLTADVNEFIGRGDYEMLMEVKDDGESVRICTLGDEDIVKGFVFFATEYDEVTFIYLDADMPREDFNRLMAQAMSDM